MVLSMISRKLLTKLLKDQHLHFRSSLWVLERLTSRRWRSLMQMTLLFTVSLWGNTPPEILSNSFLSETWRTIHIVLLKKSWLRFQDNLWATLQVLESNQTHQEETWAMKSTILCNRKWWEWWWRNRKTSSAPERWWWSTTWLNKAWILARCSNSLMLSEQLTKIHNWLDNACKCLAIRTLWGWDEISRLWWGK